jgi:hypothetical protein
MKIRLGDNGATKAFKHIFKKPATTKYPFVKPQLNENYRAANPFLITTFALDAAYAAKTVPQKP